MQHISQSVQILTVAQTTECIFFDSIWLIAKTLRKCSMSKCYFFLPNALKFIHFKCGLSTV